MTREERDQKIQEIEKNGYKYHHSALERGYICKDWTYISEYKGRFGEGYVIHNANNISSPRSNNYHSIYYYVK